MDSQYFKKLVEGTCILSDINEANFPALLKRGLAVGVTGQTEVDGKILVIAVAVSNKFPNEHPVFFFCNQQDFGSIPHVEEDGFICYTHDATIVLDIKNPYGIIKDCFELAIRTLSDGLNKKNHEDFYNEYEAYWRKLNKTTKVFTNILIRNEVAVLKYIRLKGKDGLFVASQESDRTDSYGRFFNLKNEASHFYNGLFIPIIPGSRIFIPTPNHELRLNDIRELLKYTSPENKVRIEKHLSKPKLEDLIIFCLPQPNGFHSLFGVWLKSLNYKPHPLL